MKDFIDKMNEFFSGSGLKIAECIIILLAGMFAVSIFMRIFKRIVLMGRTDRMLTSIILRITDFILRAAIILIILDKLNVSMTSFVVVLSAAGLAVSLALQDWLANFANGLALVGSKPFKVGDFVSIGGEEGYVREIRFLNTIIDTIDNKRVVIPNKSVFNSNIKNYNANDTRMVELYYGVDYNTDIEFAKTAIAEALDKIPAVHKNPAPLIRLFEYEPSALKIRVRVWCDNDKYTSVLYEMQEKILETFRVKGIIIPYNQTTISIRNDSATAVLKDAVTDENNSEDLK